MAGKTFDHSGKRAEGVLVCGGGAGVSDAGHAKLFILGVPVR
jgi:hypothetical protein